MLPQLAPPTAPGTAIVSCSVESGANRPLLAFFSRSIQDARSASVRNSGVRSSTVICCRANGAGFVGNGCVGQVCSPGTVLFSIGRSSIGHSGLPVSRSKTNRKPCLAAWATASTGLPSCITVISCGAAVRS